MKIPSELIVLKVIAKHRPIKGKINLHNLFRELQEKGILKTEFNFVKYSFGYYSKDLEEVLSSLKNLGLIRILNGSDGFEVYEITDRGIAVLESLHQIQSRGLQLSESMSR
ncbi:MAG: hypothetical protein RMI56_06450 [Sulfolobales archaeon]|nr:putative transcriptional regulator [Sulfolobales archaeon]MDW8083415.1 hypothetical protein [Sulfolobales archaeon]